MAWPPRSASRLVIDVVTPSRPCRAASASRPSGDSGAVVADGDVHRLVEHFEQHPGPGGGAGVLGDVVEGGAHRGRHFGCGRRGGQQHRFAGRGDRHPRAAERAKGVGEIALPDRARAPAAT